ncbi:MAG: helix-turn-helix domain-containing protein [Pseudomonadota bacterium]
MTDTHLVDQGLLLHVDHLVEMIRRQSGEAFAKKVLLGAKLPWPWDCDEAQDIRLEDEAELIRLTADLSGDIAYPTRLGLNYSTVTSVPGYISRSSRTLRSAIRRSKRYTRFSATSLDYELRQTPKYGSLRIWARNPTVDRNFYHREFSVFAVLSIIRYLLERNVQPVEITFRHTRDQGADDIRRCSGCRVLWDMPEDSIRLTQETLDLEIPTYDPRLRDFLTEYGEELLQKLPLGPVAFGDKVQTLIVDCFEDGAPSADGIAEQLGMSRRTLTRRLSDEGLTFRHVLDDVRLDLAHSYLHDTTLSLSEISFRLGYADQAAFTTAYKRWTGKTPSHDRASHHC